MKVEQGVGWVLGSFFCEVVHPARFLPALIGRALPLVCRSSMFQSAATDLGEVPSLSTVVALAVLEMAHGS